MSQAAQRAEGSRREERKVPGSRQEPREPCDRDEDRIHQGPGDVDADRASLPQSGKPGDPSLFQDRAKNSTPSRCNWQDRKHKKAKNWAQSDIHDGSKLEY